MIDDGKDTEFLDFFKKFSDDTKLILKKRDEQQRNLLHLACEKGRVKMVEELLDKYVEHKVPLDSRDITYSTPLDLACTRGFDRISKQLYEEGEMKKNSYCTYRYWIVKKLLSPIKETKNKKFAKKKPLD